ncbi:hypothetical protein SBRCBS47491_008222 [Sporothrix bragantina]|uniref:Uncharacterized protein n=1 Tax=Sporothrix bragantina TaxID=671064 RepID=A0ABP0CJM2_9PEZI
MPSYAYNDPDAAGRLLTPAKRKRHQVRIQGRLVLVRSVSAVNLASPLSSTSAVPPLPSTLRDDPGVGNYTVSSAGQQKKRHNTRWTMKPTATAARRQSYAGPEAGPEMGPPSTEDGFFLGGDDNGEDNDHDGAVNASASDTEEDEHETALRDRQRRGYGIGGAGNIRRPTEVKKDIDNLGAN